MKKGIIILLVLITFLKSASIVSAAPSLSSLNTSIQKAAHYYEGLYADLGSRGAVVNEYYSSPKSVYTVRHGVVGGIYFYTYIGDTKKAAQLLKFANTYGFNPDNDIHSFIWKNASTQSSNEIYTDSAYHDCFASLPTIGNEVPYHSKVCKAGAIGRMVYQTITKQDTLLPTVGALQTLEAGKTPDPSVVGDLQNKFKKLGYGMPICLMGSCEETASTIRTAEFGELELRLGNMQYADKIAEQFLKAQNERGAVYFSFDKNGHLKDDKGLIYKIINKILSDNPIFKGYIPTNAETLNDVLAFLLHYRCIRFNICNRI